MNKLIANLLADITQSTPEDNKILMSETIFDFIRNWKSVKHCYVPAELMTDVCCMIAEYCRSRVQPMPVICISTDESWTEPFHLMCHGVESKVA